MTDINNAPARVGNQNGRHMDTIYLVDGSGPHDEPHLAAVFGVPMNCKREDMTAPHHLDALARADRLAACWNACRNIDTETLQRYPLGVVSAECSAAPGVIEHLRGQVDRLQMILDDVLRQAERAGLRVTHSMLPDLHAAVPA